MSYPTLGNSCRTQGYALTSNNKFTYIDTPSYNDPYTRMDRYPARSYFESVGTDPENPKKLKMYRDKDSSPIVSVGNNTTYPDKYTGCSSCSLNSEKKDVSTPPIEETDFEEKDVTIIEDLLKQPNSFTKKSRVAQDDTICTSCKVNDDKLYPILDPLFNLREIAKNMLLLEDHLFQMKKRCAQCIIKHSLTIEALFDEAITLDINKKYVDKIIDNYTKFKKIQIPLHNNIRNKNLSNEISHSYGQQIRDIRKPLSIETYDLC